MKQKLQLWAFRFFRVGLMSSFFGGLLWSIIPMGGNTLPHLIAARCGTEFIWAALLVSVSLGLLCVMAMVLFSMNQVPGSEEESGIAQR